MRRNTIDYMNIHLHDLELMLGHNFRDKNLLVQACFKSPQKVDEQKVNNDSFEFIGDKVITMTITRLYNNLYMKNYHGYRICPTSAALSKYVNKHIRNEYFCRLMALPKNKPVKDCLVLGQARSQAKSDFCKVWADYFEALFGALAIDCNYDFDVLEKAFLNLKFRNINGLKSICESELKMRTFLKERILS